MTAYVLGSNDSEIKRLDLQASWLEEPTRLLLRLARHRYRHARARPRHRTRARRPSRSGRPGRSARGRWWGSTTTIGMLAAASARAEGRTQVRLRERRCPHAGLSDEPFDAVVGRLILFHLPDAVAVVRHHVTHLCPGGRFVGVDYDVGSCRAEPPLPLFELTGRRVIAAFRSAGADPVIGTRLALILAEAGLVGDAVDRRPGIPRARRPARSAPCSPAWCARSRRRWPPPASPRRPNSISRRSTTAWRRACGRGDRCCCRRRSSVPGVGCHDSLRHPRCGAELRRDDRRPERRRAAHSRGGVRRERGARGRRPDDGAREPWRSPTRTSRRSTRRSRPSPCCSLAEFALRLVGGLRLQPARPAARARSCAAASPQWVSAKPKRFAWTLGLVMALAMAVITNAGIRGSRCRSRSACCAWR